MPTANDSVLKSRATVTTRIAGRKFMAPILNRVVAKVESMQRLPIQIELAHRNSFRIRAEPAHGIEE